MGLEYNEKAKQWEWEGSVKDLVATMGDSDARVGFVLDKKSGAKIAMNIDGSDDPAATEPFYIESPDSENMYDAYDRKEAVKMLNNIRAGQDADDDFMPVPAKRKTARKRTQKVRPTAISLRSIK